MVDFYVFCLEIHSELQSVKVRRDLNESVINTIEEGQGNDTNARGSERKWSKWKTGKEEPASE